jgi:hypothetical protein
LLSPTTATHLLVTTQPPVGVAVGAEFGVVVSAEDDAGNVDTSDNQAVAVSLANNPAGATLGGSLTAPLVNGVATFTGLTVDEPGGGDALQLTSGNLAPATTRTFDVVDAPVASVILAPIASPQATAMATTTMSAPPGDVVTLTYAWAVNGNVVQTDADTPSLTDGLDLSGLTNIAKGDAITVTVTPSDSSHAGTPAVATAIVGFADQASVVLMPSSPTVGQTLSAIATVPVDGTEDPVLLAYIWYLGGARVKTTAPTQSLVDTLDLSTLPNAHKGDEVTVILTPVEDGVIGLSASASVFIVNSPPVASVTLEPLNPMTGQSLTAVATASDADGDPVSLTYVWTDATTGTTLQTTANTRLLTDTLDPSNLSNIHAGDIITVQATPNDGTTNGTPATASTTASDGVIAESATVSLSHRSSTGIDINLAATDIGGDPLTYSLVGANGGALDGTVTLTGNVAHYTPTGTVIGSDAFQFTASNGTLSSAPATVVVNLTNAPPVLAAPKPYNVVENTTLSVSAPGLLSTATDADGDPLTAALVSQASHGTVAVNPDGSFSYMPRASYIGIDSFTYRASDGTALSNVATVLLDVADIPPVANDDFYSYSEPPFDPLTVPAPGVLGNDTDVNGNPLSAVLVSGPSNGTLTLHTDGSFVYKPNRGFIGTDSFSYRAYDGTALSDLGTVTLNITPAMLKPPMPIYNTAENVALSVPAPGLLTDVYDPGNDPISIGLVSAPTHGSVSLSIIDGSFVYTPVSGFIGSDRFSFAVFDAIANQAIYQSITATVNVVEVPPVANDDTYSAASGVALQVAAPGVLANDTDVSGNALTAVVMGDPAHGSLKLNPDGSFSYTPAADFASTDSFTYVATDGTADSNIATVTLNVTDTPPVAADDGPYSVIENNPQAIAAPGVLANDAGTNGSPLTARLVAQPGHGTVTLDPGGAFVYIPTANYTGSDSFTYRAFDGLDESKVATVSLIVGDKPPMLADRSYTVVENSVLSVPAMTGILAGSTAYNHDPLIPELVANPVHGRLTFENDGSFVYTPSAGFVGTDSFSVLASDGTDLSNEATVSLTITPADIPIAQADSYTTPPGTTLTVSAPGVLANDTDPLNSPLTAVLVSGPSNGTLTLEPDGSFSYAPDAGFAGSDRFSYEAKNATNPSAPVTVTLKVGPASTGTGGQPPGVTQPPVVLVSGRFTLVPAAPTLPLVTGIANLVLSRRGLTAITLGFNEPINRDSILAFQYGVLGAVKQHRKVVYSRQVRTSGAAFEGDADLTINLARPYKGAEQVWLNGSLLAANGSSSGVNFVTTLGGNGRAL